MHDVQWASNASETHHDHSQEAKQDISLHRALMGFIDDDHLPMASVWPTALLVACWSSNVLAV